MITLPIAAGAVAYILLVFVPGQRTAADLRAQIGETKEYLAHSAAIGPALAAAEEELRLADRYRAQWREGSPRVGRLPELFAGIHRLEKQSGVQATRFDPQPVVAKESISEVPLSVAYTGSFANLFQLLYGFERLPATVWTRKVHIEKVAGNAGNVQCRVELAVFVDNRDNSDYVEKSD